MEVYRKPGSPFWWFDTQIGTRRIRRSTKLLAEGKGAATKRQAERAADKSLDAITEEVQTDDKAISLARALGSYVDRLAARGAASHRNTATLRDKLLGVGEFARSGRWCLPADLPIHTLTPLDMDNLVRSRSREGNGAQTIAHEIKMIRAAVRDAASLGFKAPDAMVNGSVKDPWRMPELTEKTRYLSWDEFCTVYEAMSPDRVIVPQTTKRVQGSYGLTGRGRQAAQDAQDLLVALTMTGGRWSEVAALTWDRVDLDAGVVRLFGTKDGEERLVGLPAQFVQVLRRRHAAKAPGDHLVFPSRKVAASPRVACRAIHGAMDRAGLNRADVVARYGKATAHSLRHTFASWVLQQGADLAEVQEALGHATMQMTRRYAHLAKRKTATKLAGILSNMGGTP